MNYRFKVKNDDTGNKYKFNYPHKFNHSYKNKGKNYIKTKHVDKTC